MIIEEDIHLIKDDLLDRISNMIEHYKDLGLTNTPISKTIVSNQLQAIFAHELAARNMIIDLTFD